MLKIDIKAGKMTFGQRIELGNIFMNEKTNDFEKFTKTIKCLYKKKIRWYNLKKFAKIFDDVVEGILHWSKLEDKYLKYELTSEQKLAGFGKDSVFSSIATADVLANKYKLDPDIILKWEYSKVFGILANDLELHKKNIKLQEIHSRK